jgi:hypothetical protein
MDKFTKAMEVVVPLLPLVVKFIGYMIKAPKEEFESISSAWPTPLRTELAKLRAEAKAEEAFADTEE